MNFDMPIMGLNNRTDNGKPETETLFASRFCSAVKGVENEVQLFFVDSEPVILNLDSYLPVVLKGP